MAITNEHLTPEQFLEKFTESEKFEKVIVCFIQNKLYYDSMIRVFKGFVYFGGDNGKVKRQTKKIFIENNYNLSFIL